jgi:potassium efflux system protein
MRSGSRVLASLVIGTALAYVATAQESEPTERRADLDEIRRLREQVADNDRLSDELRSNILGHYDRAINSLEAATAHVDDVRRFEQDRIAIGRMVEDLRAELGRPEQPPRIDMPPGAGVEIAETALERERSRLAANRSALRDLEKLAEERAGMRNEFSRQLGALDQQIDALDDEYRTAMHENLHPDLKRALRSSLLARRQATTREIEALRARIALLEARGTLLPWQIDQAQRRVARSEASVRLLADATREIRRREAAESLREVQERSAAAAALSPALAGLADDSMQLAHLLWGVDGVYAELEETARILVRAHKHVADLDRAIQLTRRKFEAYGDRGAVTRWWPDLPDDFPPPGKIEALTSRLEQRIPEIQYEVIQLEQRRSETRKLTDRVMLSLAPDSLSHADEDSVRLAQNAASELLVMRREILDELIQRKGRLANQLIELQTIVKQLLSESEMVQDFLREMLLWVRSVPRPIIPRPQSLAAAVAWLTSPGEWRQAVSTAIAAIEDAPTNGIGIIAVLGLLLVLRGRMQRRLIKLAERVTNRATDSFAATLEATLWTGLLAAPLPLALHIAGLTLGRSEPSSHQFAAAGALQALASIAAYVEINRQMLAPSGLAEAHFGWPAHITRAVHRNLLWPGIVYLLLMYVAIHLGIAGMRLESPVELQAHNNSLGRVAAVLASTLFGIALMVLFRPRSLDVTSTGGRRWLWSQRLYIAALPAILLSTLIPAALAALGYYITAYAVANLMLQTLWLLLWLSIASGLLLRWRVTRERALEESLQDGADATRAAEMMTANQQVRQLFRFALIVIGVFGVFSIWAEALPALHVFKRVQILPRVRMIEYRETIDESFVAADGGAVQSSSTTAQTGGTSPAPLPPGLPQPDGVVGSEEVPAAVGQSILTVWSLIEAIIAALVTIVLVKNLPGLLQLTLQARTGLDRGARIAIGTLLRYVIVIAGSSITFGLLGISWGKIQWLAAALTFGLGFGLQEIVANFVSGLILLVERPVRVGDVVTLGNLQGTVSRIQIRATTISLWDRSEMIVPNKEFITTKLVNWTLSDSKRRSEIPLRIAYGTDLDELERTLIEIAEQHPKVLQDPSPHVLLLEFGDDAIKVELRYYVEFGHGLSTKSDLQVAIDSTLREKGIELAVPQLHIQVPPRRLLREARHEARRSPTRDDIREPPHGSAAPGAEPDGETTRGVQEDEQI